MVKLQLHQLETLQRRYGKRANVWLLIMYAVLEIVALQLDDEGK